MKLQISNFKWLMVAFVAALVAMQVGCASIAQVGAAVGEAVGVITPQQGQSMIKVGQSLDKTFADITPEQEYYIGRAVGATVVSQYKVYDQDRATEYINQIGQSLALVSIKPETFGGYHFLILESDEINAFAAPGGFIFLSRGMLRLCRSEDDVAAVLAHEIGHVELQHALRAIKGSRLTGALTTLAVEGAKSFGGEQLAQLTEAFEGSIGDITGTLMNSGYARKQEYQADESAIRILKAMGYDPRALPRVLNEMQKQLKPERHDFAATHPPPQDRVKDLEKMIGNAPEKQIPAARQKRFAKALGGI